MSYTLIGSVSLAFFKVTLSLALVESEFYYEIDSCSGRFDGLKWLIDYENDYIQ